MLRTAGKSVLITAGTACISYGMILLEQAMTMGSDATTAIILLILGLILTVVGFYLIEEQSASKAAKKVYAKLDERLKELERKRSH